MLKQYKRLFKLYKEYLILIKENLLSAKDFIESNIENNKTKDITINDIQNDEDILFLLNIEYNDIHDINIETSDIHIIDRNIHLIDNVLNKKIGYLWSLFFKKNIQNEYKLHIKKIEAIISYLNNKYAPKLLLLINFYYSNDNTYTERTKGVISEIKEIKSSLNILI